MDFSAVFHQERQMPGHDIIVIGASAGGVEALTQLVADLPSDLPAAIFVVVHFPAWGKSILPQLLNGSLHADHAKNNEKIEYGRIYVAPPDYHLLVKRGYIRLVQGPKENNARPAVDPLFRTAARAYKRRVVGVVLSGTLDDGTAGLIDLKRQGGVAVVQDPTDAFFSGMPKSAIEHADVDFILPLSSIAPALVRLAHETVAEEGASTVSSESEFDTDTDIVEVDGAALRERGKPGTHSSFTCPDCGGSLFQLNERGLLQYRCRVGHAYSAETLVAGQSQAQEEALWAAIRSLEERAELMYKMAKYSRDRNKTLSAQRYEAKAKEAEQRSDFIRQGLFQGQLPATVPLAESEQSGKSADGNGNSHSPFKVVVLAASEGGLRALSHILPAFPPDFPAAIIVVQKPDIQSASSLITDALNRPTTLPLKQAQEGEPLKPGMVYVAPPNQHLLVTPEGTFCLSGAVLVDFARPSADLLLQSLAASFKERAIAVILSGIGSDGATGVQAIHKMGGLAIAQDESTSEFFEMPRAAIETGSVDFVLPLHEIGSTLVNLVVSPV
ncbi:chemotaxis protein CheB [Coleofasciculus sp. FACHB-SPT9]|uniref:chemotaxis protein CheB n=2 Tax=Cyanobacteriota TaxID=1117 RepID=UPI0030D90A46